MNLRRCDLLLVKSKIETVSRNRVGYSSVNSHECHFMNLGFYYYFVGFLKLRASIQVVTYIKIKSQV